ncbi:UMP kinase [Patescibacteria group bacterium]|nr:UMP kinase [Patescibacteria group bacterium]MBU1721741.1 UMP kinase [Patescibacteria group bacterium]MBU1901420.1 UMP kinase [Patescibacteria group bacterium]
MSKKIISVGGSMIIPKTGFDTNFLRDFRALILEEVERGTTFVLVAGGGATCRYYQDALKEVVDMSDESLDWMGIAATRINAEFLMHLFQGYVYERIIANPTEHVETDKPIIIGCGWKPGHSSDVDAIVMAQTYGADTVMNISNITHVYDKDPNEFSDAVKIEDMDWESFRRDIVGYEWKPGSSAPFDPIASKMAHESGLVVQIVQGTALDEVAKALRGEAFEGTLLHV